MATAAAGPTKSNVDFNFGEATADVTSVVGAARPGARTQRCYSECCTVTVTEPQVQEWVEFVKGRGVAAVISLLTDDEVNNTYSAPGVEAAMKAAFGPDNYARFDAKAPGTAAKILDAIGAHVTAGHNVLVHCWGGGGRTGTVLAAWVARSSGKSAAEAADAVVAHARALGVPRRADAAAVEQFLQQ